MFWLNGDELIAIFMAHYPNSLDCIFLLQFLSVILSSSVVTSPRLFSPFLLSDEDKETHKDGTYSLILLPYAAASTAGGHPSQQVLT